ncbi:MAG TPA: protoglobin domain-containing protein [Myxococcota bacterium]|nr:protoglobin domain-containing protein [Myxococcota bacterium]
MLNHELRLAFYELGDEDRKNLSQLRPLLEKWADSLVAAFYRHLLSFQATRELLADPDVKDRLLVKQREYLLSLADPGLDADYFAQRLGIGRTHVRVGLEPRFYLGAYSLYLRLLVPAILENWQREPALAERIILSLEKLLMLDASVAMDSYIARREERLAFLNQELANASRESERRFEAEHERSRDATARARAAEQLVSLATLVAGLAHEIGTPMGVIRGHAELLESSVADERGRKRLQTIREQIDRISHIIQTLLNMARPGARDTAPVDVCALLRETLAFLAEKLRAHAIETRLELPPRAMVRGSSDKLQQVLINLVINAVDAMSAGGQLSVSVDAKSPDTLAIRVADTGQGMDAETQARIFEPFFSTKPPGSGSGLGLVVVREIVSDHGGSIEVSSSPGHGTEFIVTLPRLTQSDAPVKSGT